MSMEYIKPSITVYDSVAIEKIRALANSCATNCTNYGCGGSSNTQCGPTTTYCANKSSTR